MKELLETFSIEEIFLFLVLLAVAVKSFFTFWDWAIARLKQHFSKEIEEQEADEDIKEKIEEQDQKLTDAFKEHEHMHGQIDEIHRLVNLLIESDKDDIKAWITEKHHYFCYEKGYIDDYSLDCIEKRFKHYEDEGGNSFIKTLMKEIRSLPKASMDNFLIDEEKEENK